MTGIVIGVDGSSGATRALQWAAREAELHGWDLTAVLAWGFLSQYHSDLSAQFDPEYSDAQADEALGTYIDQALGAPLAARVHRQPVCDLPAPALLAAGADADLIVVGARGLGGFKALLLGSVSQHCLHHATRPIAIIRDIERADREENPMERIVVGVDGSETSRRALRWALDEAKLRQARLEVLLAWHVPYVAGYPYAGAAFDPATFEEDAHKTLDEIVDSVDATGLPQPIDRIAYLGDAATGLLTTAKGADLVVVGSRGLGGFTGLLLGSVGHHVAHHAPCPVVIIPPGE